jgi:hypothetical protein
MELSVPTPLVPPSDSQCHITQRPRSRTHGLSVSTGAYDGARNLETTPDPLFRPSAVGIRGTAGVVGIPDAVGVVDRVRREGKPVAAVGVAGRIRIIRVRAEFAAIVPLLVIQPRRIGGERIRRRLIAEGTAVGAEGIGHARFQ